jgi:hypothetical protein
MIEMPPVSMRRVLARYTALTTALVLVFGFGDAGVVAAQPTPPLPAPAPTTTTPPPCAGEGCIPQPPASAPVPATPTSPPSGDAGGGDSGGWIGNLLTGWIHSFFVGLVDSGLNPLLYLLGRSLLATPQLDQVPVVGQLWGNSQQITIAVYVFLVFAAGLVVMAYQTLQTRYTLKEILPRLVVGFLAANLSLFLGGKAIEFANALSQAVLGDGVNPEEAARSMRASLVSQIDPNQKAFFMLFMGVALCVMLTGVLLTYIVRVTLAVILLIAAPLLLMCHALPQTEGIAVWWWKAFAGVLVVQLGQSVTLIAAVKLFFSPGGLTLFN